MPKWYGETGRDFMTFGGRGIHRVVSRGMEACDAAWKYRTSTHIVDIRIRSAGWWWVEQESQLDGG